MCLVGLFLIARAVLLVTNKANNAITYTKSVGAKSQQMYDIANQLAKLIDKPEDNLTKRDYIDYYLAPTKVSKQIVSKLPKKIQDLPTDKADELYKYEVAYVRQHMPTFTATQKEAAGLYKIMNGATQLSTVYLKNQDVTAHEVAVVGERLTQMPGVNLGTDWERSYPNGDSMTSIIGQVSNEKSGLPADQLQAYLANGYARNDRVGTSYLEKAYENVLKGSKSQTQVEIGNNNQIIQSVSKFKGQQGANLNLTIDSDYQKKVEKSLSDTFSSIRSAGAGSLSDGAYAVAMDPNTGRILAMAGQHQDVQTHKVEDDALGVINRAFVVGSAVKGATVLGALQDGVITVNSNTQADTPIYLPGTPVKKSVYPVGTFSSLDAASALEVSSNIYMMWLAMKEGHYAYSPNNYLKLNSDIFSKMRGYFNQFGLGLKTGIDLPGEIAGLEGNTHDSSGNLLVGSALDLSYGNYDNYTLIQMLQYISAIANNGYRMKPFLVNSISQTLSDGSSGPVLTSTQPSVTSKIDNTQDQINLVKQGMWQVVHGTNGWTTATSLNTLNPGVAGKTGTAQGFARESKDSALTETITESFVGYAPAKDPKIAIAVIIPNLKAETTTPYQLQIAKEMFTDFYQMNNIKEDKDYSIHQKTVNG